MTVEVETTVRGLRPEDFKLYEDGEERPVAFLNVERHTGAERPVAVVFAVDGDVIYTVVDAKPKRTTALRRLANDLDARAAELERHAGGPQPDDSTAR